MILRRLVTSLSWLTLVLELVVVVVGDDLLEAAAVAAAK